MKETGIIMSGNHPKLILDGIKTMTRRTLSPQPIDILPMNDSKDGWVALTKTNPNRGKWIKCRYGQVGDRLWVRETFCQFCYKQDGYEDICYKEDLERNDTPCDLIGKRWTPSIHMPRWASRITLEITELWAEMLRDISPTDAMAEGGYTVEEFIKLYLKINHLPEDANPWNWAIKYTLLGMGN